MIQHFLIVDDDAFTREALRLNLTRCFPGVMLTEATTLDEALTLLERRPWALIVLDISLRRRSGLEIVKRATALELDIPILVLSSSRDSDIILAAFRAGAKGYVCKDEAIMKDKLADAIKSVFAGVKYISESLANHLIDELNSIADSTSTNSLSPSEMRLMYYIGQGHQSTEIASLMSIDEREIHRLRTRIMSKLELKSNAELIRYALQQTTVN